MSEVALPGDGVEPLRPSTRTSVGHAVAVAAAGLVANGLNLIVTVVLARILPAHDHNAAYGAFLQMVGLYIVVSLPGSAIAIVVVRRSSWWLARGGHLELEAWRCQASRRTVRAFWVFAVVAACASPLVASLLGGRSWIAVLSTTLGAGCWVAIAVDRAFLQVSRSYASLAANLLVEGAARTVAVLAGAAALGVTGAVLGILVAEAVTWGHAWVAARGAIDDAARSAPGTPPRGEFGGDLTASIGAFAMLALLQYADVFLVGRLNSAGAGRYAPIAVVSKTLVYVAIVLSYYLLPEASLGHRAGEHARRQLGVVLALYAAPCAILVAVAAVAPRRLLAIVYAHRLLGASGSLLEITVAMALLGLSFLLSTYLLARGVRAAAAWLVAGTIVAFVLIAAAHGAWHATALGDLYAQLGIAAGLGAATVVVIARRPRR